MLTLLLLGSGPLLAGAETEAESESGVRTFEPQGILASSLMAVLMVLMLN